jgi:predicted phage terminase large subunit-like protein
MIFMPPGSAKSTYTSRLLPPWLLQFRPACQIIGASHTAALALDFSGKVQDEIREHSWLLGYGLRTESRERWYTSNDGAYLAAGVGGAIPGFRADYALIDDPIKSRADANSETNRRVVWEWFNGDLERRLTPGAGIVLMHCMTGDTPVLLASGHEKRLQDIRPGDEIATYEDGEVRASTVRNWANKGFDDVSTRRMKSGIVVRANARHPFLVCEIGEEKWRRTDLLKKGSLIRTVIGGNGKGFVARSKDATARRSAGECACPTTEKLGGLKGLGRHPSILWHIARGIYGIVTASISRIMSVCFPNRVEFALSANNRSLDTKNISALTTITEQERLEDCCATTAISWSERAKQKESCSAPLSMFGITLDEIVSISPSGRQEVFDIEVERTANFIANGLVSHNTRWHEDDLAGRLLATEADRWRVLCLPAEAEDDDPLGRAPGEWLWSDDDYGYGATLADIKNVLEERGAVGEWWSQYQQRPRRPGGTIFQTAMIEVIDAAPAGGDVVRRWDLAATAESSQSRDPDWTRGLKLQRLPSGKLVVLDIVSERGGPDKVDAAIIATASRDRAEHGPFVKIGLPQDPGEAGKTRVIYLTRRLSGYLVVASRETGDKQERAGPIASQCNVGNLAVIKADWNRAFFDELAAFPTGAHDDQVDALSGAFSILVQPMRSEGSYELMRQLAAEAAARRKAEIGDAHPAI